MTVIFSLGIVTCILEVRGLGRSKGEGEIVWVCVICLVFGSVYYYSLFL